MTRESPDPESETVQYVFGAGYVFGVFSTMLVLIVVLAVTAGVDTLDVLAGPVLASVGLATLVSAVVGSALFLLAFPENRVHVPVIDTDLSEDIE